MVQFQRTQAQTTQTQTTQTQTTQTQTTQTQTTQTQARQTLISPASLTLWGIVQGLGWDDGHHTNRGGTSVDPSMVDPAHLAYDRQGRLLYGQQDYPGAIAAWQQALAHYTQQQDLLGRARVLSNLSLAYQKLGSWAEAQQRVAESVALLSAPNRGDQVNEGERQRGLAQSLNTQARLQFDRGQLQAALMTWDRAIALYEAIADQLRGVQARLNQVQAMQELGYHRQALAELDQIHQRVEAIAPSTRLHLAVLRQLGEVLRLVGETERSQQVLEEGLAIAQYDYGYPDVDSDTDSDADSAQPRQLPEVMPEMATEVATLWLSLGQTERLQGNIDAAMAHYQQALASNVDPMLHLHIQLAQLQLHLDLQQWQAAEALWLRAWAELESLPSDRNTVHAYINVGRQLIRLLSQPTSSPDYLVPPLDWTTGEHLLERAVALAQRLGDQRTETYALGYLGHVSERAQHWEMAEQWTHRALALAQVLQAEEMIYQWQWQLGRILRVQGDQDGAIAAYRDAVTHLNALRIDLLATETEGQVRFQEGVEPIYRELVDLLLTPGDNGSIPQTNLVQARDVMEAFQIAELDDFFQDVCLEGDAVSIDEVDAEAAVVYPIILRDRLDVIISLPQRPLQHFSSPIPETDLTQLINEFRDNLVIRSRLDFRSQSRQLYDWLLRPAAEWLSQTQIKTLVFVLDGPLRQIPMTALNDGDRYLIEQYQVVVAPGLTLVNSTPTYNSSPHVLMAGLSKARHGFSPLAYVGMELQQIRESVSGSVLLDEQFTSQALRQKITNQPFPWIHIASHGQFSSNWENTFLIAWDKHLSIDELRQILQDGQRSSQTPIDLLVLSACETATGDPRAPLGLAGMAVKAGARSTLATQWSVNDGVTAQFMAQFYRYLAAGMTKAEALRQSQLWLLQFERFTHPLYWAPYVLIGDWH
ncbi:MAG: CHAT domain-containing protein [Leptolyngbyaceae cyanobacterium]